MQDDLYVLPSRAREAQRIYQELQEMSEAMHLTDAWIAYLQSWEFFTLLALFAFYKFAVRFLDTLK